MSRLSARVKRRVQIKKHRMSQPAVAEPISKQKTKKKKSITRKYTKKPITKTQSKIKIKKK